MEANNKTVINVVTMTLAGMGAMCVLSVCILAYCAKQIPPELNTLTGGLVGALSAMLVKTSPTASTSAVQDVNVTNPDSNPVPVDTKP